MGNNEFIRLDFTNSDELYLFQYFEFPLDFSRSLLLSAGISGFFPISFLELYCYNIPFGSFCRKTG